MVSSGAGAGAGAGAGISPEEDEACRFHMNVLSGAGNPLEEAAALGKALVVIRARDNPCDHVFR